MGFQILKFFGFRTKRKSDPDQNGSGNCRNVILCKHLRSVDVIKCPLSDSDARKFSWNEIESSTKNFATVIGSGGFSNVYLARMTGRGGRGRGRGVATAVKIFGSGGSERLHRMFKQELDVLLQLNHRNIVNFIGYCDEREEGALVFEYIANGNLQEKLHGKSTAAAAAVLPWRNRLTIAFQLASAIEYLHEKCTLQIVHSDIKSSNILLDENLNSKLCDFGSAKIGFSSTVTNPSSSPSSPFRAKQLIMGSPGYTDPQYLRTGIASKKNDVYSFGVVLLELITGKEAFYSEQGLLLTSIMAPAIRDGGIEESEVMKIVDPRLLGDLEFDVGEARVLLSIASLCLSQASISKTMSISMSMSRPTISSVLKMMRENIKTCSVLNSDEVRGKSSSEKHRKSSEGRRW